MCPAALLTRFVLLAAAFLDHVSWRCDTKSSVQTPVSNVWIHFQTGLNHDVVHLFKLRRVTRRHLVEVFNEPVLFLHSDHNPVIFILRKPTAVFIHSIFQDFWIKGNFRMVDWFKRKVLNSFLPVFPVGFLFFGLPLR